MIYKEQIGRHRPRKRAILYSLYDALVSIAVPSDKARVVVGFGLLAALHAWT